MHQRLSITVHLGLDAEMISRHRRDEEFCIRSVCTSESIGQVDDGLAFSLQGLLSYQDVMNAIEREFHLHAGQEREIIMKLWLKGQTMISILQRYRFLLQDLNLDDQDFLGGMKVGDERTSDRKKFDGFSSSKYEK